MILEIVVSACIVVGATFTLIGSFGLVRLPDFYARLHAPTKATTLGVGALILASVLHFSFGEGSEALVVHEILVSVFLFLTAPVSAHLLVQAALNRKVETHSSGPNESHGHPHPHERE